MENMKPKIVRKGEYREPRKDKKRNGKYPSPTKKYQRRGAMKGRK